MNAEPEKKGEEHPLRSEDPEEIPILPKDRSEEGKRNEIKSGVPDACKILSEWTQPQIPALKSLQILKHSGNFQIK